MLMLRRMTERYKAQNKRLKRKPGDVELTLDQIDGSEWEQG